ncbi:NAD(P)-dependent oxidoreductase [Haloplasma contractile]|uniref:3-hydroxyisobutyrate dehydrogenase protein n=1 Tax=Haloplasma contractile SSD-17B TaxID=1033810 RepID=U2E9M9_9MOLU|nr:NAD(P)-dependent oxidoreductase [Haloplasma contractile]ERJ11536.1 3-hydroxyisobutyrate dehydrogenase protein [Haloplasma contractile SSD-17B]
MNIGFIGLGVMGKPMAHNLIKNGYNVFIYNRTESKAEDLLEQGAIWCESTKELTKNSDLIITIVGTPSDVEELYLNKNGIIHNAKQGTIIIDMTTSTPTLAKRIYQKAQDKGIHTLDAPVSGGDIGAEKGTLSIMVGGDEEVFEKCLPLLTVLGKNIVYQGDAGNGQHTKVVNQIAIAGAVIGVVEALTYAKSSNLDLNKVLQSISNGAASSWQLKHIAPKIIEKDYQPGFYIKHFVKDMQIAQEEAHNMALDLPNLNLVESIYETLIENGFGNLGTQAIAKYYDSE